MTTLGLSTVGQPHMSGETVRHSRKCIGNIHTVRHSRKRMEPGHHAARLQGLVGVPSCSRVGHCDADCLRGAIVSFVMTAAQPWS